MSLDAPADDLAAPERALERLAARRDAWVRVGLAERVGYLERAIDGVLAGGEAWVREACRRRALDADGPEAGEEWLAGPMVTVRCLRLYARALRAGGRPRPPGSRTLEDGQRVFRVFPCDPFERFLYHNMTAELWIEPQQPETQGRIYRDKESGRFGPGRVALVLGAGNVSSIAPLDVAYKLFVEDQVALLKMNPVNAWLGPYLERAFAALIADGFLAIVYGGAELGERLCAHPAVDTIHLTGSASTHDRIVWGDGPERERRRAAGNPRVDKTVTSELGCVTPVLVVPGGWSAGAVEFQARHVAAMVAHNASFNCNAAKVLVLARGWAHREAFLGRLRTALANTTPRHAYYPGATERYRRFLRHYPAAEPLGAAAEGVVPWTLIPDVPARAGEYALTHEAFCGVLAEVTLEAADAPSFLDRAVEFANEAIQGTLSCTLLVDPATRRSHPAAVERAIARLRYGGVGVNAWTGVNFSLGSTSWGAFPGHTLAEAGSGRGVVHNAFFFDHPQKSVVRAPFRIWPKPVWFAGHRTLDVVGRHLARVEARRSLGSLLRIAWAGLRG